jgi:hypothetical protein
MFVEKMRRFLRILCLILDIMVSFEITINVENSDRIII